MITLASILAAIRGLAPYLSDGLDLLKKHWKLILQVAAVIWIIICVLTHCNPAPPETPEPIQFKPIPVNAARIPEPVFNEPRQLIPIWSIQDQPTISNASGARDSVKQLLAMTDWLQNELYGCDSTYRADTDIRNYQDVFETDSFEMGYSFDVAGKLVSTPTFDVRPTFPIYSKPNPTETTQSSFIYLEGSVGPRMTYSTDNEPIQLSAIGGELGIGYTAPNGWSYGVRAGASQLDWSAEVAIRKSFAIKLGKGLRSKK